MSAHTILRRTSDNYGHQFSLSPDAAVILIDDGTARVLDMGDHFYALPAVSTMFLRETLERGPDAAVARVSGEYGVSPDRAEADLNQFLQTLVERGIVWRNADAPRRATSLASRTHAGALRLAVHCLPSLTAKAAVLLTGAKLSLAMSGFTRTVAAWKDRFSTEPAKMSADEAATLAKAIDDAVCSAAAWNPLGVACKERGLAAWALARMLGLPATLVIGIELYPFSGHCWCEAASRIISDHPESCRAYFPALRYE